MRHLPLPHSDAETPPSLLARRLQEAPIDSAIRFVEHCGPRPATGLGEARAAAAVDGRLRRSGLQVAADIFTIQRNVLWLEGVLSGLALLGAFLYYWLPIIATALFMLAAILSALQWQGIWSHVFKTSSKSQNVVATRAAEAAQQQRIVILAPLDSPLASVRLGPGLVRFLQKSWLSTLATSLMLLFALLGLFIPLRLWLIAILIPLMLLLSRLFVVLFERYSAQSPGAIHHAGPLAVLLACSNVLDGLQSSELWAVALGASSNMRYGLQDLLARYPFDKNNTLFIVLEGIGATKLCSMVNTAEHEHFNQRVAEAIHVGIELTLCPPRPGVGSMLIQQGYACIALHADDGQGRWPYYGSPNDMPEQLDAEQLVLATRFVVECVRALDGWQA